MMAMGVLAFGLILAAPGAARAAFPDRPIRIVTPYSPGGATDLLARLMAPRLAETLGQPVVVENRTGGSGMVGGHAVASAPADGHVLLIDTPAVAVNAALLRRPIYNAATDLDLVAVLVWMPFLISVHPAAEGLQTLPEMLAAARREPGRLAAAVGGSSNRAVAEMLQVMAGIRLNIVPYRGAAPAVNAVLARDVPLMVSDIATVVPFLRDGRMRGLAVTTAERTRHLPEVPTAQEAGIPGMVATQWFGIFAPRGVPQPVLQRLNREFNRIVALPELRSRLGESMSSDPAGLDLEASARFYREELARWQDVIRRAGIQQE